MRTVQHAVDFADNDARQRWSPKRPSLRRRHKSTHSARSSASVLQNAQKQSARESLQAWSKKSIAKFQAILYKILSVIVGALEAMGAEYMAMNPPLSIEDEEILNAEIGEELQLLMRHY